MSKHYPVTLTLDKDVRAHLDNPFLLQPEESDEYALISVRLFKTSTKLLFWVHYLVITEKDLVLEECVGKGSFAVVYRRKWAEKEVALKKMRHPSGISPVYQNI